MSRDQLDREQRDSYTFLPHARSSLYSTLSAHFKGGQRALNEEYSQVRGSVRLTLERPLRGKFSPTSATVFRADETELPVDLTVEWIDVILYPPGFGFLVYKVETSGLSIESAGVVHRSFKKVLYSERLRVKPAILHGLPGGETSWQDILSELLSEFDVDIRDEYAHIHASSFRVLSLALVENLNDEEAEFGNIRGVEEGHLISLITGEDLSTISHPGKDLVEIARKSGRLDYWRDWSGVFLWDDVAFIGVKTEFTTKNLVHNVEALYAPLFIYTLFQHARLHEISHQLTKLAAQERVNRAAALKQLEALNSDLLSFRSHYMFWEVSRAPVIVALFGHLIAHFETNRLFDQIERDIQRAYTQESKYSQDRLARIVGVVTFVTLPVTALLGVFNQSVQSTFSETWQRWMCFIGVGLVSVVLGFWAVGSPAWLNRLVDGIHRWRSAFSRLRWAQVWRRALFGHQPGRVP